MFSFEQQQQVPGAEPDEEIILIPGHELTTDELGLPAWGTTYPRVISTCLRVVPLIWKEITFIELTVGIWAVLFIVGILPPDGVEFNSAVFSSSSFILAFLLTTRLQFSLNRYEIGTREYLCLCNGILQITTLVLGTAGRISPTDAAWTKTITTLRPSGQPITSKQLIAQVSTILEVIPRAILLRYRGDGHIDSPFLHISQRLVEECAGIRQDGIQFLFHGLLRRLAVLSDVGVLPMFLMPSCWRVIQDTSSRLGQISAVRRTPPPFIYRAFLLAIMFLYLSTFTVVLWHSWGYSSFVILLLYSYAIFALMAVADYIREAIGGEILGSKFLGVDSEIVAVRTTKIVQQATNRLLDSLNNHTNTK